MTEPSIPFFSPRLFEEDRERALRLIHEIGTAPEQRFILGEFSARLERELADRLGAGQVVLCGSGTSALTMALAAVGVGAGDEVLVPALGCAPLAAAAVSLDAVPVFADVDPLTLTMDPEDAEARVTPRTRAVVPAHLFSVMADMPRFADLAKRRGLRLVEDSAVAQGAVLQGRPAGRWGEIGILSFVQVKSFGMPGEGGALVTDDDRLAELLRMFRNHGQRAGERFTHRMIGWNSRFDELQARFQLHRLAGLAGRLARRAAIADRYTERLAPLAERGVLVPPGGDEGRCAYVYTVLADNRDALSRYLQERGVATHVYYPRPLPRHAAFARHAPPGARWPRAERASARLVSLPLHPGLTDDQVDYVADRVTEFTARRPVSHPLARRSQMPEAPTP
ncbi:DegT/DnrJ/EryC1/StrS family aminotransferase [Streptomyces profundus]|uniref:DegT/DnrJ/EryC1/StrS family aminotransferase n=1 Tax=Streptomyces profundus TaxID=2867410 RepID=UPI001D168198|nr:DegT/DnrJ/EryC1/StrS family aminotransferase [Streptomyces sp. MA3_2.13]UED87362.1 DegT/DnrJ/EryC1/StrS family aminotransferase [Streptomyces sp. MA3_2.13]